MSSKITIELQDIITEREILQKELEELEKNKCDIQNKISAQTTVIDYLKNKLMESEPEETLFNILEAIEKYFKINNVKEAKVIEIIRWLRVQKVNPQYKNWEKSVYQCLNKKKECFKKIGHGCYQVIK